MTQELMRHSLYFAGPGRVEVRQEPMPVAGVGQVLVQTAVSAVSAGTEMLLYRGQFPQEMALDETIAALAGGVAYPVKYGYAAVGRVVAVGAGVDEGWLNRLVFAFNPHESHFVADAAQVLPVPEGMSAETAVFLPNMETAVSFVMDGQPMIGEQVLVLGQGVVGLLTTALLAQFPLASLVAVDGYPLRREWSQQLGAHHSLDTSMPLPAGFAADLVYELSGNPIALNGAIEAVRYNGRILVGSWYGNKPATLNLGGKFHRQHLQLISSQVSYIAPQWNGRWDKPRRLTTAWQMLTRLQPQRLITHQLPITQAVHAYHLLDQTPQQVLQLVFSYKT